MDTFEEMFEQLERLVNENYRPVRCGWTSQRSYGNYDDCFDDGYMCGQSWLAYELGKILEIKLEDPDKSE